MSAFDVDAALVARVQQGDRMAFDLLVHKYQRKIMRLIASLVGDASEVEDVAQETFIKAWRSLPQFRGDSSFYSWLYRIAINSARSWQASSIRRRTIAQPDVGSFGNDDSNGTFTLSERLTDHDTPLDQLASRQMAHTVQAAMQALPEDWRTALLLREAEGLSYVEIAQMMMCPVGTVRSRIFRARQAIAEQLRPLLEP